MKLSLLQDLQQLWQRKEGIRGEECEKDLPFELVYK